MSYNPCIWIFNACVDVFGQKLLACLLLDFAADVSILTSGSIEELKAMIICYHPDARLTFGLNLKNAVRCQLVATLCATKSDEAIAIIAAETVIGGKPHQAIGILSNVGDDIGRKTIAHAEGPDIAIRLCKGCLLGQDIY